MTHLHNGRPCLTCSAAATAATLERSRHRAEGWAAWLFLAGLSLLALAYLLT